MGERHELLTAAEVAARLRVTVQSVYRWAKPDEDGKIVLPAVNVGGIVRFRADDVDALLRSEAAS